MKKSLGKILIADDNPDILRVIELNLRFEGYETIKASDGKQAYELAVAEKPDLIILDVLMPEIDGWQALSHLKSNKATMDIPVVMLTGVSMKEGKERGLIEGVEDFLSKPFNPLRLIEVVADILSGKKTVSFPKEGDKIRIALIGGGEAGLDLVKTLTSSATLKLIGYCDVYGLDNVKKLIGELESILLTENPLELANLPDLNLIMDMREEPDPELDGILKKRRIEVIRGLQVELFKRLLKDEAANRVKERSLVKELNTRVRELSIINEMARLLTSPLDLTFLLDKVSHLATSIADVDACAILIYDEDQEKFVVSNIIGLNDEFKKEVKLSLSDTLLEEIMALHLSLIHI